MHYCRMAMLITLVVLTGVACKTKKKAVATPEAAKPYVAVSNIELYNKPLDTIVKYVTGQRWKMIYSIGGMTGKDRNEFDSFYYTINAGGKLVSENDGKREETSYEWLKTRDIFTGDSIYVLSGAVQWKMIGIHKDTLMISDNFTDGYHYALTRAK